MLFSYLLIDGSYNNPLNSDLYGTEVMAEGNLLISGIESSLSVHLHCSFLFLHTPSLKECHDANIDNNEQL